MGNGGNLAKAFELLSLASGKTGGSFPLVVSATIGGLIFLHLFQMSFALFRRQGFPFVRRKTTISTGSHGGDFAGGCRIVRMTAGDADN